MVHIVDVLFLYGIKVTIGQCAENLIHQPTCNKKPTNLKLLEIFLIQLPHTARLGGYN